MPRICIGLITAQVPPNHHKYLWCLDIFVFCCLLIGKAMELNDSYDIGNLNDITLHGMESLFSGWTKMPICKYIFILSDGITDTAIIEEGIDYLLFLTEQEKPEVKFLKPKVKFLSIESPEFTTPKG